MPIKSYLIFPHKGKKQELIDALGDQPCEIMPAKNRDLLVLVSDTKDEAEEETFLQKLSRMKSLDHFTLVAGFND